MEQPVMPVVRQTDFGQTQQLGDASIATATVIHVRGRNTRSVRFVLLVIFFSLVLQRA